MQENKFKMKHLIGVLKALKLGSMQDLFTYLSECSIYELKEFSTLSKELQKELKKSKKYEPHEMVNILQKTDDIKMYDFVLACLIETKSITENEASELITSSRNLLELCLKFQNEIIVMQSIVLSLIHI